MTSRKRWKLWGVGVLILVLLSVIYFLYFAKPTEFPKHEQLIEKINGMYPKADANVIQDTIFVDSKHVFVPFVSSKDHYGLSFWIWKNNKWKLGSIHTSGMPRLWKLGKKPSTYYYVWNISSKDELGSFKFYLIRKRGYTVSHGVDHVYEPEIQVEQQVVMDGKQYGVAKLSDDVYTTLDILRKLQTPNNQLFFQQDLFMHLQFNINYIPFDKQGNELMLSSPKSGSGHSSSGDIDTQHIFMIQLKDLETAN